MLVLFASKLLMHSCIFAIFFSFIAFSIFTKFRKKDWSPMLRLALLLMIVADSDRPRIENRGNVDSTFQVTSIVSDHDFKITTAYCDLKNMEHPWIKRLLLKMLVET